MGFLASVLTANGAPSAWDDYWYADRGIGSPSGVAVSGDRALTLSQVYACTRVISEDIAKIPLDLFEELGDLGRQSISLSKAHDRETEEARALAYRLSRAPNAYQTAFEFLEMMTAFAALRKFGIAEIRRGTTPGFDDQYIPLHPDLVTEDTTSTRVKRYTYRDPLNGGQARSLLADEVIVLKGPLGKGVLEYARDAFGIAIAQERHVGVLFGRGARFQGVISHKATLNPKSRENIRTALDEYSISGERAGRPLLLEEGMTWQNVSLTNADAELIDSRRFSVIDACRWFRVPPHKIFELERSTKSNIEQQSVDYVVDSLLGWAERWEQVLFRDTIVAKARFFPEFDLDGLMRGDFPSRSTGYALAIQWGWMDRNEVRAKENLNPRPGASQLERPLNMEQIDGGGSAALAQLEDGQVAILRGRLKLHAADAASRVVRREIGAMSKLAEKSAGDEGGWRTGVDAFYAEHVDHVARALHVPEHEARRYAAAHRDELLAGGPTAMDDWLVEGADALARMALEENVPAAPAPAPTRTIIEYHPDGRVAALVDA